MDDRPNSDDKRRGSAAVLITTIVILILCLPLLYVLSLGPAVWLVNHEYLDLSLAQRIYWPLEMVVERFDWLQPAVQWYVSWFE